MSLTPRTIAIGSLVAFPFTFANPQLVSAQQLPSFAIISAESLTNTGPTTIDGDIAVSPGVSYTGSGSVTQTGSTFIGDAVGVRLQNDLTSVYSFLAGLPTSTGGDLTGQDLGGMTLLPGVYNFDSGALLSAGQTLTFDAGGDPDAVFIINIGSTLTAGSGASVILQNGATGGNIFYRVGSSATLDTSVDFLGQIIALTSISLNTAATLECGAAFARTGSITLDTNTIGTCTFDGLSFIEVIEEDDGEDDDEPDDDDGGDGGDDDGGDDGGDGDDDGGDGDDDGGDGDDDGGDGDDDSGDDDTPVVTAALRAVLPDNALNVARAIAIYEEENGGTPLSFAILAGVLSREELSESLVQLSGEVSTGVSQMGLQSMDSMLDLVTRAPQTSRQQLAPSQNAPSQNNNLPVGTVPDRSWEYTSKYDTSSGPTFAATPTIDLPMDPSWDMWATGYGSKTQTEGLATTGNQNRTITTGGLAVGLEMAPSINSTLGFALAFDQGSLSLEDGLATAESTGLTFAVFGTQDYNRGYISGALAYGRNDVTTNRTITVAGTDSFSADVATSNIAGNVEAGYYMGAFTPFIGLRAQSLSAPAYSETTVSGASTYALDYEAQTTQSLRSELGVAIQLVESTNATLGMRASWAHEFKTTNETNASFQSIPGPGFTTTGATQDSDSLILALNGEIGGPIGFYAGSNLVTTYSGDTPDYGGSVSVGYRW